MTKLTKSKFIHSNTNLVVEAIMNGSIDINMFGLTSFAAFNNVMEYQIFGEQFLVKQVANSNVRLKNQQKSSSISHTTKFLVEQFGRPFSRFFKYLHVVKYFITYTIGPLVCKKCLMPFSLLNFLLSIVCAKK
jgi:hypothetical protein